MSRFVGTTLPLLNRLLGTSFTGAPGSTGTGSLALVAEGTWTPAIAGSTTPGTQTYTTQLGYYVRIGNWVFASFHITLASLDGAITGNVTITGLPVAATSGFNWAGSTRTVDRITHAANMTDFALRTNVGGTALQLSEWVNSAAGDISAFVPVTALAATSSIGGAIFYKAA